MALRRIERLGAGRLARIERIGHLLELGRATLPVVQRGLQRARDGGDGLAAGEVAADDDERAVAAALLEGGEFHG